MLIFYIIFKLCSATFIEEEPNIVTLPNAECMPRETVVSVDAPRFIHQPSKVLIHRCDGSFQDITPSLKGCVHNSSEVLKLKVQNIFTLESDFFYLENHTTCKHQCVFDGSQCGENQLWDAQICRCTCNHQKMQHTCPENYMWEPYLCQCVCNLKCPFEKHYLDEEECSCTCKPNFYRNCNRKNKILSHESCTCLAPEAIGKGTIDCNVMPTKWAIVIIFLSFLAIFIIGFDCILYTRKTGCVYNSISALKS